MHLSVHGEITSELNCLKLYNSVALFQWKSGICQAVLLTGIIILGRTVLSYKKNESDKEKKMNNLIVKVVHKKQ